MPPDMPINNPFRMLSTPWQRIRWGYLLMCRYAVFFLSLVIGASLYANELPEPYFPVGAAGMGGAQTALASDENAVWTNPGGISRIRKARSRNRFHILRFPNVTAGYNQDGKGSLSLLTGSGREAVEDVVEDIENLQDRPFWGFAGVFPMGVFDLGKNRPLAFGMYSATSIQVSADQGDTSAARIKGISDQGMVLSYAMSAASNRVGLGVQVRPIFRFAYEDSLANDVFLLSKTERQKYLQTRFKDRANKSQGLAVDMGAMWTFADFWYPTLGVAIYNLPTGCRKNYLNPFSEVRQTICGTVFTGDIGNEEATSVVAPTDIRVGFSISPRPARRWGLRFAVDAHHLYATDSQNYYGLPGVDVRKLLHAGVELYLFANPLELPPISLKAGASQGFFSSGATLRAGLFTMEVAVFGRDVSSKAAPSEDRRILGSFSLDF